ncbi:MAG: hypothetical protein ACRYF3_03070, partial [Janthinobacterium lividum]
MCDTTPTSRPSAATSWRGEDGGRALLLIVTALIVLVALVRGEHSATLRHLQDDVKDGKTSRVEVSADLPPGATGYTRQEVRWRAGWQTLVAEVQLVVGDPGAGTTTLTDDDGSALPISHEDVGAVVQGWNPTVRVDRVERGFGPSFSATVLGVGVPDWVGLLVLLHWLGAVLLLVRGRDPRWATRWAWFWLSNLPFGVTAFLLLSGPLP